MATHREGKGIWGEVGRYGENRGEIREICGEMGRYVEVGGRKEGGALDVAAIWAITIRPDWGVTFVFSFS